MASDSEQGTDLDPGDWDSFPADSEAKVDYAKPLSVAAMDVKEVRVEMCVWLPDGSRLEYSEVTEFKDYMDEYAQALAMAETVSEVMLGRLRGIYSAE